MIYKCPQEIKNFTYFMHMLTEIYICTPLYLILSLVCTSWKWHHHAETCWNKVMTIRSCTVSVFCWYIKWNCWRKMHGVNDFEITGCNLTTSVERMPKQKQWQHSMHIHSIQCWVFSAAYFYISTRKQHSYSTA